MDRGAWWAVVHGVAQSWTRLKRLSSSSSNKEVKGTFKKKKQLNGRRGVELKGTDLLHSFIFVLWKEQQYEDFLPPAILPGVGTRLY